MANGNLDLLRPTQDSRSFYMLPQSPMDSGYYTYGEMDKRPDKGGYQYPHPIMMTAIIRVAFEWQATDRRRIGIGNISRADGRDDDDHASHLDGLQVDVRPLRKDGLETAVVWTDSYYDREGTAKLIGLFRTFAPVKFILFNDTSIPFVRPAGGHNNHFHVALMG